MSVSTVSTSTAAASGQNQVNWRSNVKQGKQDFSQLLGALQSGDVSGAQQAFAAMQQLLPGFQTTPQDSTASTGAASGNAVAAAVGTDFRALGMALNSGSLSGAKDAVSKLQQDAQTYRQEARLGHLEHAENVYKSIRQSSADGAGASTNPLGADMAALGQALQSGSMTSAQDAFAKLQQDLQQGAQSVQQGQGSGHHLRHSATSAQNFLSSYLANSVIGSAATTASSAGASVQVSV